MSAIELLVAFAPSDSDVDSIRAAAPLYSIVQQLNATSSSWSRMLPRKPPQHRAKATSAAIVFCDAQHLETPDHWPQMLASLRRRHPSTFVIALIPKLPNVAQPKLRLECFAAGARMVTTSDDISAIGVALGRVARHISSSGIYTCSICHLPGLDEASLREHTELAHQCEANVSARCPICATHQKTLAYHLKNAHGPVETREPPLAPYPAFAWCVVRRDEDGKFLLVSEPAAISRGLPRYWLPAGRVDAGETFGDAARRECLEEAGINVDVVGVLKILPEIDDGANGDSVPRCLRVALLCRPMATAGAPKAVPDWESCGACWVGVDELAELSDDAFRSPDPATMYPQVARGALTAASLQTDAWRALDAAVAQLTAAEPSGRQGLQRAWPQIQEAYVDKMAY